MTFTELSVQFNHKNWEYLNISDAIIRSRYDWVTIYSPIADRKFPWAHENDMVRLFLMCRTFKSKTDTLNWIAANSQLQLSYYHLQFLDRFCYSDIETLESIDFLIQNATEVQLIHFIHSTLDRSLAWHNPESCWPGDLKGIVSRSLPISILDDTLYKESTEKQEIEGVYFVSVYPHTHTFYKFQNLLNGIEKRILFYNLKDLAKQAHDTLIQSMLHTFSHLLSSLDDISWERKMSEISELETDWCKAQLMRLRNNV